MKESRRGEQAHMLAIKKYITAAQLVERWQQYESQFDLLNLKLFIEEIDWPVYLPYQGFIADYTPVIENKFIIECIYFSSIYAEGDFCWVDDIQQKIDDLIDQVDLDDRDKPIKAELYLGDPIEPQDNTNNDPFLLSFNECDTERPVLRVNSVEEMVLIHDRLEELRKNPSLMIEKSMTPFDFATEPLWKDGTDRSAKVSAGTIMLAMSDVLNYERASLGVDQDDGQQDEQLNDLPHAFRALYESMGAGELPDIDLLIAAWRKFWKDRTPTDGKQDAIKPDVAAWIMNRMEGDDPSKSKAMAMASIIRPSWASNGGRPSRRN